MRITVAENVHDLDLPAERLGRGDRVVTVPVLADVATAVAESLEAPFHFPPLRRALTPEDHVVIVVDPFLTAPVRLLTPLLRHLTSARIDPAAITLVCPLPDQDQSWLDDLPDEFQEVRVEVHNPTDRNHLAYLATTQKGRRIYLNRTVVDADQAIVVTRTSNDSSLGHGGGASVLFPGLSDEASMREVRDLLKARSPESAGAKLKHEAEEVAWLLGAPFFLQVIEGIGDSLTHVIAGTLESCREASRLLDQVWKVELDEPADVVAATITGHPASHTFEQMARALAQSSHIVRPGGRIVLLCEADPEFGPAATILRDEEEPHLARQRLLAEMPPDLEAGLQWLQAAEKAKVYIFSHASQDTIEELFATPLDKPAQVRKLLADATDWVLLPDAHKTRASVHQAS